MIMLNIRDGWPNRSDRDLDRNRLGVIEKKDRSTHRDPARSISFFNIYIYLLHSIFLMLLYIKKEFRRNEKHIILILCW